MKIVYALPFELVVWSRSILGLGLSLFRGHNETAMCTVGLFDLRLAIYRWWNSLVLASKVPQCRQLLGVLELEPGGALIGDNTG